MATQPESILLVSAQTIGPPSINNGPPDWRARPPMGCSSYPSLQRARIAYEGAWHSLLSDEDGGGGEGTEGPPGPPGEPGAPGAPGAPGPWGQRANGWS